MPYLTMWFCRRSASSASTGMKPVRNSAATSSGWGRASHSLSADSRHSASACRAAGRLEDRKIGTP